MQLTGFRHKGLKQVHAGENGKGVPATMADKLRKLLFAFGNSQRLGSGEQISGVEVASVERLSGGFLESDRYGKLAVDFSLRGTDQQRQRFDVHKAFRNGRAVNDALRLVIELRKVGSSKPA